MNVSFFASGDVSDYGPQRRAEILSALATAAGFSVEGGVLESGQLHRPTIEVIAASVHIVASFVAVDAIESAASAAALEEVRPNMKPSRGASFRPHPSLLIASLTIIHLPTSSHTASQTQSFGSALGRNVAGDEHSSDGNGLFRRGRGTRPRRAGKKAQIATDCHRLPSILPRRRLPPTAALSCGAGPHDHAQEVPVICNEARCSNASEQTASSGTMGAGLLAAIIISSVALLAVLWIAYYLFAPLALLPSRHTIEAKAPSREHVAMSFLPRRVAERVARAQQARAQKLSVVQVSAAVPDQCYHAAIDTVSMAAPHESGRSDESRRVSSELLHDSDLFDLQVRSRMSRGAPPPSMPAGLSRSSSMPNCFSTRSSMDFVGMPAISSTKSNRFPLHPAESARESARGLPPLDELRVSTRSRLLLNALPELGVSALSTLPLLPARSKPELAAARLSKRVSTRPSQGMCVARVGGSLQPLVIHYDEPESRELDGGVAVLQPNVQPLPMVTVCGGAVEPSGRCVRKSSSGSPSSRETKASPAQQAALAGVGDVEEGITSSRTPAQPSPRSTRLSYGVAFDLLSSPPKGSAQAAEARSHTRRGSLLNRIGGGKETKAASARRMSQPPPPPPPVMVGFGSSPTEENSGGRGGSLTAAFGRRGSTTPGPPTSSSQVPGQSQATQVGVMAFRWRCASPTKGAPSVTATPSAPSKKKTTFALGSTDRSPTREGRSPIGHLRSGPGGKGSEGSAFEDAEDMNI